MSNKQPTTLPLAIGAAFIAGLATTTVAQADVNPFSVTSLSSGYMVADKGAEGQCGANKRVSEAECGASKAQEKLSEGECGASKKVSEGECGADKKAAKPKPVQEAKCGEAKCGNNK